MSQMFSSVACLDWCKELYGPMHWAQREKCPNTALFLVPIFLYSDWIRRDKENLSVFSPNTGKYGSKWRRIWTLFTQLSVWPAFLHGVLRKASKVTPNGFSTLVLLINWSNNWLQLIIFISLVRASIVDYFCITWLHQ